MILRDTDLAALAAAPAMLLRAEHGWRGSEDWDVILSDASGDVDRLRSLGVARYLATAAELAPALAAEVLRLRAELRARVDVPQRRPNCNDALRARDAARADAMTPAERAQLVRDMACLRERMGIVPTLTAPCSLTRATTVEED